MTEFQNCYVIQWTIEKFSVCRRLTLMKSSLFREDSSQEQGWFLNLCPNSFEREGFISIQLRNESSVSGTFNFTISVIDSCGSLHFSRDISATCDEAFSLFEISDFINWGDLLEKKTSLLPNDSLTVQCIIRKPCQLHSKNQGVKFEHFSYKWPITNFSNITPNDNNLNYPVLLRLENAPKLNLQFHVAENSGAESNIFIKINKIKTYSSDVIYCPTVVSYEISTMLINKSKIVLFRGECELDSSNYYQSNSSPVINLREFSDGEGILVDDTLTLVVNLLIVDSSNLLELNFANSLYSPTQHIMNLDAFQGNLYEKIYEEKKFCDLVLKVGTSSLHAHKAVLHAQSPVFRAMFDSDMAESDTNVVEIVDFDADTMHRFLQFLYTGKVAENLPCEDILKLYAATHKYQVPYLNAMRSVLISKIRVDNVWKMWFSTVNYEDEVLKASLISYISEHTSESLNMLASVEEVAMAPKLGSCLESTNEAK